MLKDGGGYNQGSASQDLTELLAASKNGFVGVIIQYRVRA
jgi:carboxylesterase type B